MLLPRTPSLFNFLFKNILFRIKTSEKCVYLSFDDGPHPTVTPWVLQQLDSYHFKATFFLIGKNALEFPEILKDIQNQNHQIGNHSFSHKNALKSTTTEYLKDLDEGQKALLSNGVKTNLFRPPYGKLTWKTFYHIKNQWSIVLWDIIAEDFSAKNPDKLLHKLIRQTRPGSIVVFHDSEKCFDTLQVLLPKYLDYLKKEGYLSKAIQ